jgi:hypothetical protein
MKKILILLLVLGLASSANAALTLVSSDGDTLDPAGAAYPSATRIGIYNDTAAAGQGQITVLAFSAAEPGAWVGTDETFYSPPSLGPGGTSQYYGVIDFGMGPMDTWYSDAAPASPDPYGIGTLVDYGFNCTGMGTVTILLLAQDLATELDRLTITQIPEPMTIALLGLGSLFLLRRRK